MPCTLPTDKISKKWTVPYQKSLSLFINFLCFSNMSMIFDPKSKTWWRGRLNYLSSTDSVERIYQLILARAHRSYNSWSGKDYGYFLPLYIFISSFKTRRIHFMKSMNNCKLPSRLENWKRRKSWYPSTRYSAVIWISGIHMSAEHLLFISGIRSYRG